jgi:outer membrane lipoprotein-sorting protein
MGSILRFTLPFLICAGPLICVVFPVDVEAAGKLSPRELVARSEKQVKGDSFKGQMKMTIVRNGSERTLEILSWLKGDDKSLVRILSPAKDRGSGTLRLKLELWQFLPKVERIVKIPASMMLQSWMGSDFSNDDLVKSTSLSRDYTHKLLGSETVNDQRSFKIECTPKTTAPIVWGKVIVWVRESDQSPVKQEYFSERGKLIKTFEGFEFKTFGKRTVPTRVVMTPGKTDGNKTVLVYSKAEFDSAISDSIFTQSHLRSELD